VKVGDLVIVKGTSPEGLCTGVIVSTEPPESLRSKSSWYDAKARVGVMWADGGHRIDWASRYWLEVLSESR
jgi:hypothetical protein